jgi:hypothetical protein
VDGETFGVLAASLLLVFLALWLICALTNR